MFTKTDLYQIFRYPVALFGINLFLYTLFPRWSEYWHADIPLHFLGGLSIACGARRVWEVLRRERVLTSSSKLALGYVMVATVALVAVLWEGYEFFWDLTFGTYYQKSNFDTSKDLLLGLAGGLVYTLAKLKNRFPKT
ncbi:MAG: hypothetical protein HYV42_00565 [Candidatus Magasanikbacteria bacterium]|nr:hypothetical protein [Candidatus Magasanikbacteria bacterium]